MLKGLDMLDRRACIALDEAGDDFVGISQLPNLRLHDFALFRLVDFLFEESFLQNQSALFFVVFDAGFLFRTEAIHCGEEIVPAFAHERSTSGAAVCAGIAAFFAVCGSFDAGAHRGAFSFEECEDC